MRNKRSTLIGVGVFVGLGFAVIFLVVSMLGRERNFFTSHYTVNVHFEDVRGLRKGAFVQLAGINIGYVDQLRFSKSETHKDIEVVLILNESYKNEIRQDSEFKIETQGLLGDKYIYVTLGSESLPVLPENAVIVGKEAASFLQMAQEGSDTLKEVKLAAKSLNDTLSHFSLNTDSKKKLDEILSNLQGGSQHLSSVLAGIDRGEGTLGALVKDPSLYQDVRSLLGHANRNTVLKTWIRSAVQPPAEGKP